MALPTVHGEFKVVNEPELRFSGKGNAWAKVRCLATDRVKGEDGKWENGDSIFIDVVVINNQAAQNLVESVSKDDLIVVVGRLRERTWEKDGQKRSTMDITAESVSVSLRGGPARTSRTVESPPVRPMSVQDVQAVFEASEPPF